MVRPASPPLPSRRSFAKVPELGSWALAGAARRAIGDAPGDPRGSPQPSRTPGLRGQDATYHAGTLHPTLFPALPRDRQTRPAFDLETPRNLYAAGRGHRAHRSAGCLVSFLLFCKLCRAECPVTSLGSLQNQRGDESLLERSILMHIQPGGLGLLSSPKCASGHSAQNPSRNLVSFLFSHSNHQRALTMGQTLGQE